MKRVGVRSACIALVTLSACDVKPVAGSQNGSDIPAAVQEAFNDACAVPGCHQGSTPAAGLNLSPGASDAILSATSSTGVPLADVGDLYNSYIALKVLSPATLPAGAPSVSGAQMPFGTSRPQEVAVIVAWLAGVDVEGSGETGGEGGGEACLGDAPPAAHLEVSFEADIYPIMQAGCILEGCHLGEQPRINLTLPKDDPMGAYDLLVNVPSVQMTNSTLLDPAGTLVAFDYVEPDDPTRSYLWHKVAARAQIALPGGGGKPMPLGGQLCDRDLNLIHRWILEGAMP